MDCRERIFSPCASIRFASGSAWQANAGVAFPMSCTPANHTASRRASSSPPGSAEAISPRTLAGSHLSHNRPATAALSSMCRHSGSHPSESLSYFAHTVRTGPSSLPRRPEPDFPSPVMPDEYRQILLQDAYMTKIQEIDFRSVHSSARTDGQALRWPL